MEYQALCFRLEIVNMLQRQEEYIRFQTFFQTQLLKEHVRLFQRKKYISPSNSKGRIKNVVASRPLFRRNPLWSSENFTFFWEH